MTYNNNYNAISYSRGASKEVEPENSYTKRKNRTRQTAAFLRPDIAYGREGDGYKTRKGKKSAWLGTGSHLPAAFVLI